MFYVTKSIDIDFAHHVSGHKGACINIHGHTWKFEVTVQAEELDPTGFVLDFKRVKEGILMPVHALLDHALVLPLKTADKIRSELVGVGRALVATRPADFPTSYPVDKMVPVSIDTVSATWPDVQAYRAGGMKITTFNFTPTSERIAGWFYKIAESFLDKEVGRRERLVGIDRYARPRGVMITNTKIYETLHPVESVATYIPIVSC